MCPRSGFRFGGTCECILVPVFVLGVHPNVPSFRLSFRGNIDQNHPFGKPPFVNPRRRGCESKRGHSTKALHAIFCGLLRKVGLFCKPYSRGLPKGVPGRWVPVMKCIKCIVTLPHFATLLSHFTTPSNLCSERHELVIKCHKRCFKVRGIVVVSWSLSDTLQHKPLREEPLWVPLDIGRDYAQKKKLNHEQNLGYF